MKYRTENFEVFEFSSKHFNFPYPLPRVSQPYETNKFHKTKTWQKRSLTHLVELFMTKHFHAENALVELRNHKPFDISCLQSRCG